MKLTYTNNCITLKALNETYFNQIKTFYSNNSNEFDKYEVEKPTTFYEDKYMHELIRAEYNAFIKGAHVRFYLFDNSDLNTIIGTISFYGINRTFNSCIVGYKIDKNHQHRGYATQMLNLGLQIMFKDFRMHRIEAYIHPSNKISLKLINSCGFISEGVAHSFAKINGDWQDHYRYVYIS